jgi:hypothetical protein
MLLSIHATSNCIVAALASRSSARLLFIERAIPFTLFLVNLSSLGL